MASVQLIVESGTRVGPTGRKGSVFSGPPPRWRDHRLEGAGVDMEVENMLINIEMEAKTVIIVIYAMIYLV